MTNNRFRLISWNIAGKVVANRKQFEALGKRKPDIVALQEVRVNALKNFRELFPEIGLSFVAETATLAKEKGRRYGELIASRWPLQPIPGTDKETPFPERVLSSIVQSPWGNIELYTVHIVPGSTQGWKKIEMFEGIYRRLACESNLPRILCGDFNSPKQETTDGQLITWGEKLEKNGEISGGDGRWAIGERSVLKGLAEYDLPDVFRLLNGYEVQGYSWFIKRKRTTRRRFDHIFAAKSLNAVECQYLGEVVEQKLSDHAAIEAVFEPDERI